MRFVIGFVYVDKMSDMYLFINKTGTARITYRNINKRSHNYFYRGNEVITKHYMHVCVLILVTQHANRISFFGAVFCCHWWPLWLYHIFFHIIS
jgi:hypothetical protein